MYATTSNSVRESERKTEHTPGRRKSNRYVFLNTQTQYQLKQLIAVLFETTLFIMSDNRGGFVCALSTGQNGNCTRAPRMRTNVWVGEVVRKEIPAELT